MKKTPCHDCALLSGSITQKEPHNVLKAEICVLGGLVFYCHDTIDGWKTQGKFTTRKQIQEERWKPCAGWAGKVQELAKIGYFHQDEWFTRLIQQERAKAAIAALDDYISLDGEKKREEKEDARLNLEEYITDLRNDLEKFKKGRTQH